MTELTRAARALVPLVLLAAGCGAEPGEPPSVACGNAPGDETLSPSGARKVVVFVRDCGATTEFSTRLAILPYEGSLAADSTGFAIVDPKQGAAGSRPLILPDWTSDTALVVRHLPSTRWLRQEPRSGGVAITYQPLTPDDPVLIDVSGDDCTASALIYDRPPGGAAAGPGVAFVNDGCAGDRIFLGFGGTRLELRRSEDGPLGTGGAYSDEHLRVEVVRGREVRRAEVAEPQCGSGGREWEVSREVRVTITAGELSWVIDGTLEDGECEA